MWLLAVLPVAPPVTIETSDVVRFYRLYTVTRGHPSAEQIQREYLDPGSDGLHRLLMERPYVTAATIAKNVAARPAMYEQARRCIAELPSVRTRLVAAFDRLRAMYSAAQIRPITIVISRGKPAGIADASGVIIGLEAICTVAWMNPNLEDRLVHVISHEETHVQQALAQPRFYGNPKPTLLQAALIEGTAEFIAELISGAPGEVTSSQMLAATRGHEKEIETRFVRDEDKTDLSNWIDNSTLTQQGDLGYWVGYRIVKSYYECAANKRSAIRDLLQMNDARAFMDANSRCLGASPRLGQPATDLVSARSRKPDRLRANCRRQIRGAQYSGGGRPRASSRKPIR
jgi:uncharacterized protein YjaZ